jgi:uncharacterized membrane protein
MSFLSFRFLRLAIFSLPLHIRPASMGACILIIVVSLLTFFVSINITLAAIFITLVYISGILILFSYFFSLIQNSKIGFSSLAFGTIFSFLFLLVIFNLYFYKFDRKIFFIFTESFNKPFL